VLRTKEYWPRLNAVSTKAKYLGTLVFRGVTAWRTERD
jgi:hypothetical protein